MKKFLLAAALLFLATTAQAQIAVQAGGAQDWIKVNDTWEPLLSPLAGISYDIVLDQKDGKNGISVALRTARGDLDMAGTDAAVIAQYGLEYWEVPGPLEWFVGGQLDTWGDGFTGEREFLGGVRAGLRFEIAQDTPFEFSAHYSFGTDDLAHAGIFFGFRRTGGG